MKPAQKGKQRKISRRKFLASAAVAGVSAGAIGFPAVGRVRAASPITLKIQTAWDAGTLGYVKFQEFCKMVGEMSEGKLVIEGFPAGAIVGTFEMFDAVKAGVFDGMHCFDVYWPGKIPVATFLSSYPFGMDRPDQWETWYNALGGKEMAREAYGRHNMYYIGPIQHDDNLIHSKVPIRSFEDFKGKKIRYPGGIIADIYRTAGVSTVLLPGGEVYPALEKGVIDASDYVGAAINYNLGFGEIAKYIIMGPPSTPCLHQPVDLMSLEINLKTWRKIPKHFQMLLEAAVAKHSYDQYSAIQKADIDAFEKMQKEQGVEVIRLKEEDIQKFKRFAPALWVKWAKKSPLAMKAFKSQLAFMKSVKMGYITDRDLVDLEGRPLKI
ncbi:MAG: TRAP transporter substrate-binding protein DctP [Deltaproteobacteria bacterium]|nr:TRAP transporter substrate-binding protein DctP [Deltaproteobacteria bacterium]MBW1960641.1 TRAP transporter substrate-binding protein DctP [Deltaproteobacteria bacterium]MBW2150647.1 TRAP transporter substrate-binding protein DctP [Deltaproteobacteria bacterium]